MAVKCDFSGYATKNDVRCSDNKVIRHGAFAAYDGKTVPLVWQHKHGDVENVLGHADLEVREDGVYAYAHLNNTDRGRTAREMVKNGDIKAMSIYATHVRARGNDVVHGELVEVSLVLRGANPGALIDQVSIEHGDNGDEIEAASTRMSSWTSFLTAMTLRTRMRTSTRRRRMTSSTLRRSRMPMRLRATRMTRHSGRSSKG